MVFITFPQLLRLIERHVNNEVITREEHNGSNQQDNSVSANILVIRFSLKAIVNLNSSSHGAQQSLKLERALKGTNLGLDLAMLAAQDELIGFYIQLLTA